jgi:peptidoglycan/LPS O-acetylase OafA/YrhL
MVVYGAVLAVVAGLAHSWGIVAFIMVIFLFVAAAVYAQGGEDTDTGAIIGHRADERQASMQMKVLALQGKVTAVAAGPIFSVAVLGKVTNLWPKLDVWPFAIPVVLAGLAGLAGWVIYRERGEGDEPDGAHGGQAGPRIEPRVPVDHL